MTETIYRTFKYRLYPTQKEIEFLEKNFEAVRFVYNHYREEHEREYNATGKSKGYFAMNKDLTRLYNCKENEWLHVTSRSSLSLALKDLDKSYTDFFRAIKRPGVNAGYPKFRNKHKHNSFRVSARPEEQHLLFDSQQRLRVKKLVDFIHGEKITNRDLRKNTTSGIRIAWSRPIEGTVVDYTIKRTLTDKYFVSFRVKQEVEIEQKTEGKEIGIDLGTQEYVVTNEGIKFDYPRYLEQSLDKLAREQAKLSRMVKGSNNRKKQVAKVAKVYEKITNQRNDFQNKLALQLVRECKSIATETLNIKNMQESHVNARHINDAAWFSFLTKLEYKAKEHGVDIKKIKKYFASSKTCFHCETVNDNLKPSDRTWSCSCCGAELDRDVNAAQNILRESQRS